MSWQLIPTILLLKIRRDKMLGKGNDEPEMLWAGIIEIEEEYEEDKEQCL